MKSITEIRDSLRQERRKLQESYVPAHQPARLLQAHTRIVDQHLCMVWQQLAMPRELALVAVGGYGRAELFPKSDIDLLILLPQQPDEQLQQRLQDLVGKLWDIGLEVGHSVRTIEECMKESSDVTVQTNLLEARHVTGNHHLFLEMRDTLAKHLDRRAFYQAKVM